MKKILLALMILTLLALTVAAQAASLSDIGDKPEPTPRTMPEPTIQYIPPYSDSNATFIGKIILPDSTVGIGYEYGKFPTGSWEQLQKLIQFNNSLVSAGYRTPDFKKFEGEKQEYLTFSANKMPRVYVLPYLKQGSLIVVVKYSDDIIAEFPDDVKAEDAFATLAAKLEDDETRNDAAKKLATIMRTGTMNQAVNGRITADNMDVLMPVLIRNDFYTAFDDNGDVNASSSVSTIGSVIRSVIGHQETVEGQLAAAKKAAETIAPVVDERYLQVSNLVENSSNMTRFDVTDQMPAIPEFDSSATVPNDLKDDGEAHRYVIVSESGGNYSLMPFHALFLPTDQIAESIGDADRIIVCHNYKKRSSGNWIGGTPSDSLTSILLYEAATGELICKIGFTGNYQGGISHGGIPYHYIRMGETIANYFSSGN